MLCSTLSIVCEGHERQRNAARPKLLLSCFTFNIFAFFSVVEGTEDNSSDEDAEEVREVTKLLSGGIMETQFGDLNVFANANRDTPTPPMTGMNI